MIKYLRYYFSAEGQRKANENWNANAVTMHERHEHESHLANIEWQKRKDKEDAEIAAFVAKIKNFFTPKPAKKEEWYRREP